MTTLGMHLEVQSRAMRGKYFSIDKLTISYDVCIVFFILNFCIIQIDRNDTSHIRIDGWVIDVWLVKCISVFRSSNFTHDFFPEIHSIGLFRSEKCHVCFHFQSVFETRLLSLSRTYFMEAHVNVRHPFFKFHYLQVMQT